MVVESIHEKIGVYSFGVKNGVPSCILIRVPSIFILCFFIIVV